MWKFLGGNNYFGVYLFFSSRIANVNKVIKESRNLSFFFKQIFRKIIMLSLFLSSALQGYCWFTNFYLQIARSRPRTIEGLLDKRELAQQKDTVCDLLLTWSSTSPSCSTFKERMKRGKTYKRTMGMRPYLLKTRTAAQERPSHSASFKLILRCHAYTS